MELTAIVSLYVEIIEPAIPVAMVFGFGDLIVGTFLRAAFGGRLALKSFSVKNTPLK